MSGVHHSTDSHSSALILLCGWIPGSGVAGGRQVESTTVTTLGWGSYEDKFWAAEILSDSFHCCWAAGQKSHSTKHARTQKLKNLIQLHSRVTISEDPHNTLNTLRKCRSTARSTQKKIGHPARSAHEETENENENEKQ